jgi:hypothetical protein
MRYRHAVGEAERTAAGRGCCSASRVTRSCRRGVVTGQMAINPGPVGASRKRGLSQRRARSRASPWRRKARARPAHPAAARASQRNRSQPWTRIGAGIETAGATPMPCPRCAPPARRGEPTAACLGPRPASVATMTAVRSRAPTRKCGGKSAKFGEQHPWTETPGQPFVATASASTALKVRERARAQEGGLARGQVLGHAVRTSRGTKAVDEPPGTPREERQPGSARVLAAHHLVITSSSVGARDLLRDGPARRPRP